MIAIKLKYNVNDVWFLELEMGSPYTKTQWWIHNQNNNEIWVCLKDED